MIYLNVLWSMLFVKNEKHSDPNAAAIVKYLLCFTRIIIVEIFEKCQKRKHLIFMPTLVWQVNDYETVIILLELHDIYTNIQVGNKYIYICYIEMWKCHVGFMSLDSFVMDQPRIFEQPTYLCTVDWYSKFWLVLLNTYIGKLVTAINSSFL